MASYLEVLATYALGQVAVTIFPASGYPGDWNETEWATVPVEISNPRGLWLRHAVVSLRPSGVPAYVLAYGPMLPINTWFVGEVTPGRTLRHDFRVCPRSDGTLTLSATLSAEVVPYVARSSVSGGPETIYPL
jgi:hypothetical protein